MQVTVTGEKLEDTDTQKKKKYTNNLHCTMLMMYIYSHAFLIDFL